jgi:hypothetical protein
MHGEIKNSYVVVASSFELGTYFHHLPLRSVVLVMQVQREKLEDGPGLQAVFATLF